MTVIENVMKPQIDILKRENQYAYEKLTVDAYMEHSYQKALQALVLNRMVNDTDKAKKILENLSYIVK